MSGNSRLTDNLKRMRGFHPEVDVAADMAYKDEYINNSFFAIGHFETKGHTVNYLYHLMSYHYPGQEPEMTYCFSVTDETERKYCQFSKAYKFSEIEIAKDRFSIRTPAGNMEGDLDCLRLTAQMERASLNLTLEAVGYPLYNGRTGRFHMVGMDIYEYSIPTLKTNGTIAIDGEVYEIRDGMSWYDRQWQQKFPQMPGFMEKGVSKIMEEKQKRSGGFQLPVWDWMDINLENGDKISTWFAEEENGENCWATIMHPDSAQRTVLVEPVVARASDYWKSPQSGAEYPMTYRIQIPELEADLTVKTAVDNQELYFPENPLYNHYEGASAVSGTYHGRNVKGYCYTELIGDWSKK